MDEKTQPEVDLTGEFRQLGKNLKQALQAAWESEERKQLQQEIEDGMQQLVNSLEEFVAEFSESEHGARLRTEIEDFSKRAQSGELGDKIRADVAAVLRKANEGLEEAAQKWSADVPEEGEST
jgi:hypothetical protein